MTQPAEETPNPVLDVLAKIQLTLGGMDERMSRHERDILALNNYYFPLYIDNTGVTTSQTVDLPNILGPRTGWYWDIHTIIGDGITAGSIAIYKNSTSNVRRGNLTTSGQLNWGKMQFVLAAGDRLVFLGSGTLPATGAAITVEGLQIAAPRFGRYAE